jgi:hypothetical protein
MKENTLFYLLLALSVLTLAASIATLNPFLVAATALLLVSAASVFKLWYIIDSLIFKHTNLIEVFNGYELSGDRNCAIMRKGGTISATTAAVFTVGNDAAPESAQIENIIANFSHPFKFVMQVERLNTDKVVDDLRTKRSEKEIALSRIEQKQQNLPRINQIKREIEQLEHDISAISSGNAPLRLAYYAVACAVSDTSYDAEEQAKSRIRELSSQFDGILKSKSRVLKGPDLLDLLKLDSMSW